MIFSYVFKGIVDSSLGGAQAKLQKSETAALLLACMQQKSMFLLLYLSIVNTGRPAGVSCCCCGLLYPLAVQLGPKVALQLNVDTLISLIWSLSLILKFLDTLP